MERIAPLAKILAEANGIDWQHLQGSGDGGQIVEQDILTHLARIMSGEEEPPSTPVDAPPPDWNGEEIPAGGGMFNADMLSAAGVDSDIAAFVEQTRPAAESAAAAPAPTPAEEDELEFELEEEDTPEVAASAPTPLPVPTPEPVVPAPAAVQTPPPAAQGAAAGLGSLLSRLYKSSPTESAPAETPAAPVPAPAATPAPTPMPEVAPVTPAAGAPRIEAPSVQAPAARIEVPAVTPAPVTPAPVTPTPAPAAAPMAAEPVVTPAAPVAVTPVQPAAQAGQDAVWFGVYLRRDANVGAVTELRTQLSDALAQDVPLALLVARAAQRHAERLSLGSVALHDGARTRSVTSGHLRDTLSGLDTDHTGTPDLLVVDAGARDLDDLHFPHTLTLSIGRVQDGRAALSLNGNVDTAQAAQFLADVAGTLERPIVLVL
ncbi:E3 binding domain-containing protein [Deinococcus navajonensis]|uniref:E3 binding domain-containing protein n=1 Tax=Deinococcus navajonensis TaxID=309884 RepID=A0ABV8XN45_9DEIO